MSGIQLTEWQANAATAVFLMPQNAVVFAVRELLKLPKNTRFPIQWNSDLELMIPVLARLFGASVAAMHYRLSDLGLISGFPYGG